MIFVRVAGARVIMHSNLSIYSSRNTARMSNPRFSDLEYRMMLRREYNFTPPPFSSEELDRQLQLKGSPSQGFPGSRSRPHSFGRADLILRRTTSIEESGPRSPRRRQLNSQTDVLERPEDEREAENEDIEFKMQRTSVDQLESIRSPTGGMSFKDQEQLIQELKKENFDLKLRLYMEQKERERLNDDFSQKIILLETDLTEALDELSDALEREKDYDISLNNARRREKALTTKQRRLEETMREQDAEIKYLTISKSQLNLDEIPDTREISTQTSSSPYYEERGIDVERSTARRGIDMKTIELRDSSQSPREQPDGKPEGTKQPPEGVDLLNHGAMMARKDEILGEARRRRTLKKQKDKDKEKKSRQIDEMPEVDQTHQKQQQKVKKSKLKKFLCCGSSKREEDRYEMSMDTRR